MPFEPGQGKGQPAPNAGRPFPAEVLTETEVLALLAQCSRTAPTGIRDRALIVIMWRAGLRVTEALDLKPKDINMQTGVLHVLHPKGARPGKLKDRKIGLDDYALSALQLWLDRRRELGLAVNGSHLFCTLEGGRMNDQHVRGMLRRRAMKAGIEKRVHPHSLRHRCAVNLHDAGVSVKIIQKILGHAHLSTTDVYLDHINPSEVIAAGRRQKSPELAAR